MLTAANAVIGIGLIWLLRERLAFRTKKERKKRTRLFQSKVFEARGVSELEVGELVGDCARARCGVAVRARDTRKTKGDMEGQRNEDDLGGGEGTRDGSFVG